MLAAEKGKETEEILNSILPPIEWEEDGQLWRLQVMSMCISYRPNRYTQPT